MGHQLLAPIDDRLDFIRGELAIGHLQCGLDHRQGEALDAIAKDLEVVPLPLEKRFPVSSDSVQGLSNSAKRCSVTAKWLSECQRVSSASRPTAVTVIGPLNVVDPRRVRGG